MKTIANWKLAKERNRIRGRFAVRHRTLVMYLFAYFFAIASALRFLMYYRDQPFQWTVIGLLAAFLLLLAVEPWLTRYSPRNTHLYLWVQSGITIALSLIPPRFDFFAPLYMTLTLQAMHVFPARTGFRWIGVFTVLMAILMFYGQGWSRGLPLVLIMAVAYFFLGFFVTALRQAEAARDESQKLLAELKVAHEQLQVYTAQAEELAVAAERQRSKEALQRYAERLRAMAAKLSDVTEAERQQRARELHDQVGQNLTTLGINLNILQTQLPKGSTALLRSRVEDSLTLVEQTTERIRDVMADLRPPVLDDYGLVAALRWYGDQVARRADIAVLVNGEEPAPRLETRVENALFRIAQEALTNVAKHAQATQVSVDIEIDSGTLRMVIADDGIGFDPAHLPASDSGRGLGLLIMSERAEAVGGVFHVESHPGGGTKYAVEVVR